MSKNSRFKYQYRANASKLHQAVGKILRNNKTFKHMNSFQEYPVNKVNPNYPNGSHRFDWVIPQMKLVIECHGKQHFECCTFGADPLDAIDAFHDGQRRDKEKKQAALDAGWLYVVIAYNEKVTPRLVLDKIHAAQEEHIEPDTEYKDDRLDKKREYNRQKHKEYLSSDQYKEKLAKARKFMKEQYRKMKEMKKNASNV